MQPSRFEPPLTKGYQGHSLSTYRVFAILLMAFVIAVSGGCENGGAAKPGSTKPRRVLLVGLDGADWKVIRPLIAQGKMPRLRQLISDGASGDLETLLPTLSPSIWTTIATGVSPARHGIDEFWHEAPAEASGLSSEEAEQQERLRQLGYIGGPSRRGTAQMVLYRSTDRKVPALWTILAARGLTSDVVAWWVTYPAETIRGTMVSDRYLYNRFALVAKAKGMPYDTGGGLVSPPEAAATLASRVVGVEAVGATELRRFIDGPIDIHKGLTLHAVEDELRIVYAKDESVVAMSRDLLRKDVPRFFALYIQGVDITSHYFWKYRFPDDWNRKFPSEPVPRGELDRYHRVIDAYYERQDQNLGAILDQAGASATVIVCSDHGFVTGKRPPGTPGAAATVSGVHEEYAPPGIIVLWGPGIRRGTRLEGARVHDIAPTVLSLLGLPLDPTMEGRPLAAALGDPPAR